MDEIADPAPHFPEFSEVSLPATDIFEKYTRPKHQDLATPITVPLPIKGVERLYFTWKS